MQAPVPVGWRKKLEGERKTETSKGSLDDRGSVNEEEGGWESKQENRENRENGRKRLN